MDPRRLAAIDRILEAALDAAPGDRDALLAAACGDDASLRAEVESLLRAAEAGPGPIDRSLGSLLPGLDVGAALRERRPRSPEDTVVLDEGRTAPGPEGPGADGSPIGRRVAHYQVLSLVAVGGMGEVYLAEDARMPRKVALKILPAKFTRNADRLLRFQREARAASALNHPGIVTIYEVGEADGVAFIASEHIEGDTLRRLLARGPFTIREATEIALQVAGALSAAHAAGLVHRDIKPENLMRRRDGYVKVLDFGLVKLTEGRSGDTPSGPSDFTVPGAVLGTVRYMSPEQARGDGVDARTDLFALGAVLFEMLAGEAPFVGATLALTFDAILSERPAPPVRAARPEVPEELERIVARLLEKDRALRYQTAEEVRAALRRFQRSLPADAASSDGVAPVPLPGSGPLAVETPGPTSARRSRSTIGTVAAVITVVAVLALAGWLTSRGRRPVAAVAWQDAVVTKLTDRLGAEVFPSLSPDGAFVVYEGRGPGTSDLFLQRVGTKSAACLTAGSGAENTQPAFAPDGKRIAFRRSLHGGGGIFVMSATGDAVRQVTTFGFNPAWSPDGTRIVCSENAVDGSTRTSYPSRLFVVDVATGGTTPLDVGDAVQATWSPDGRRLAYWGVHHGYQRDVFTVSVSGGDPVAVTDDAFVDVAPVWSPTGDSLYFLSDRKGTFALWRIAVDPVSGRPSGRPELVPTPASRAHHVSFSADGRRLALGSLAYTQNIEVLGFDPAGEKVVAEPRPVTLTSSEVTNPAISPDGTLLAYQTTGSQPDVYVLKLGESSPSLVTLEGPSDQAPRWSPDGRLAFYSNRGGTYQVWTAYADGTGAVPVTDEPAPGAVLPIWSPDGTRLAYSRLGGRTVLLSLGTRVREDRLVETPPAPGLFTHFVAQSWSPDGRRLAGTGYRRDGRESLQNTGLYLFDVEAQRYEKLSTFGTAARWLSDGCRLVFAHQDKLYLTHTDDKQARVIHTTTPRSLRSLDLSSDDRSIFLSVATTEADVWLLSLD